MIIYSYLKKMKRREFTWFFIIFWILVLSFLSIVISSREPKKKVQAQPENSELECLKRVLYNLPVSNERYYAHHWDAKTGKWNEDIRFEPMNLPEEGCIVLDIGGNTDAADTNKLLWEYPQCTFHVFEPVPPFFGKLKKAYQNPVFDGKVYLHNVGLGRENKEVKLSKKDVHGQSTFVGGNTGDGNYYSLIINDMQTILDDLGIEKVSLLHMNCEGCEWESLLAMGENKLFEKFDIIQFGTHNYGEVGVGVRSWELCQIRKYLSETHNVIAEIPFGWERWLKR